MIPYQSFLAGIKPTCFENLDRLAPEIRTRLFQYPFHQTDENAAIFFQNESLKRSFLQQTQHLDRQSPEYQRVLGQTLGFPPKAAHFYARYYEWQLRNRSEALGYFFTHKVGYRYAGIMCEGHIDDLVENAEWLWDQYYVENTMTIKAIRKPDDELFTFPVRYRYIDDLVVAEKEVRQILDHNRKIMNIVLT